MAVTVRPELLAHLPEVMQVVLASGITTGSLVALAMNLVLPGKPFRTITLQIQMQRLNVLKSLTHLHV
jgi:xanthine/uracil permease